jgi:hypothetical protein
VDPGLYIREVGGRLYKVLVYVDDLLLIGPSIEVIDTFKAELREAFKIKDMGPVHTMLGMLVTRDRARRTMTITQSKFVADLLERHGMGDCSAVASPMVPGTKVELDKSKEGLDAALRTAYQQMVGSLMYLASRTRPDITYAVVVLSRVCSHPTAEHMVMAKRVLRYLQGTKDWGLSYGGGGGCELVGYADADLGGGPESRSTSGFVFLLNGAPVSWGSKLQAPVALSTGESEYYAVGAGFQNGVHLRAVLEAIGCPQQATVVHEDNQACIAMSNNPIVSKRTKHIAIKYHFVRQKVREGEFELRHCPGPEMLADALTKALPADTHKRLCRGMMGYECDGG